jgi:UDP-3-O-[3-hydroxymyristoyl] glucosamine N-acyltransferase
MKSVSELAQLVKGTIVGNAQLMVTSVSALESATSTQISFFGNPKYKKQLGETKAGAVLVPRDLSAPFGVTYIQVDNPALAFARIGQAFSPPASFAPGISNGANVNSIHIDATATIMPNVYVGHEAKIGARCVLFPGVYVGNRAVIGDDTVLKPNVSVMEDCVVGSRCLFHAGVVIGADGFGFAFDIAVPEHVKIPQVGIVRIGDDVEIGANSCIDRATTGETVIGPGTKIDNLVQVGHNSTVGKLSILCAQVGLSGSSNLGTGVILAGQVGVAGHLRIGDMAKVGAQAGVMSEVPDGETVLGAPAIPHMDFMRSAALFKKLPEMNREIKELKKQLAELLKEKNP